MKQIACKRGFRWLLTAILLLGTLAISGNKAKADNNIFETNDGWVYQVISTGESASILGYNGNATELVVPSEIDGKKVYYVDTIHRHGDTSQWTYEEICHSDVTSIVISEGITTIGANAFLGCNSLSNLVIPATVKTIGSGAFGDCKSLTELEIPEGVETIGMYAFQGCKKLTKLVIPASLTNMAKGGSDNWTEDEAIGFMDCFNLKEIAVASGNSVYASYDGCLYNKDLTTLIACPIGKETVTIPDGITRIGDMAFSQFENLTEITIPETVTSIGKQAFCYCQNLTAVLLPENLETIEDGAFFECTGIKEINIPKNVKAIGDEAFGCTNIKKLTVDASNACFVEKDGALYNKDMTRLYTWVEVSEGKAAVIPDTVTEIAEGAFYGRSELSCVAIPKSVAVISGQEFNYFSNNVCIFFNPEYTEIEDDDWNYIPYSGELNPFTDVSMDKFYAASVLWAFHSDPQITTGTSDTTFAPKKTCNRAQVVTFLWRLAGQPEPKSTENPFTDVKETDYFYKAVLWANETGVTTGTSKDKFSPKDICKRSQFVTFLWRACGSPAPQHNYNYFVDVEAGKYYTDAVLWASQINITTGTDDTHFSPGREVNRGQAVTFLFRARNMVKK